TKAHSSMHRPKEISGWVKGARRAAPRVVVASFSAAWWKWWRDINPKWREVNGGLVKEGEGSWATLDVPGQNGFLNVIVCLKWWREELNGPSKDWEEAVADVTWV
ncbi:hypothetical protein B0H10DRAFT_1651923, partial [Mycena sp. CBHHK59/15]